MCALYAIVACRVGEAGESSVLQAMLTLASMYRKGEGCPRDPAAALRCFQQAAEKGNPEAANELGVMFLSGEGTLPDESASAYWFQRAMELEEQRLADLAYSAAS